MCQFLKKSQKLLKFRWDNNLYQFTCFPNGLTTAPRQFTKLFFKPVLANLRAKGFVLSIYLDDLFLFGLTYEECLDNVTETVTLLKALGFIIHDKKSVLKPCRELEHLGFILNTKTMSVSLPKSKIEKLHNNCLQTLKLRRPKIRDVAHLVGILISCIKGVEYGQMQYRHLEMQKIQALKENKGNFDAELGSLNENSKTQIKWWLHNTSYSCKITHGAPDIIIRTDASNLGWGAAVDNQTTGGRWDQIEKEEHINILELKAAFLGLQAYETLLRQKHVQIKIDNTTAVSYLKNMGGTHSHKCNELALEIWNWSIKRNIWLTPVHIPGIYNVEADKGSRKFNDNLEWSIDNDVFKRITDIAGVPCIDLFATRLNKKVGKYFSWKADPGTYGVNAFDQCWNFKLMYAFAPFSLIPKILQKIQLDKATAVIMIVPIWPTQSLGFPDSYK